MKHENRYVWLDLARGISALLVCAGHLRAAIFVDYSHLSNISFFDRLFYFSTGLGHQSVIIFFVLSGFFVGGSVLARGNNFSFRHYLLARLSRLWVVLIPALIFTFVIDNVMELLAPSMLAGGYYNILSSGPKEDGSYSLSLETFFANVIFLQNVYAPVYGSNGPLWSLANEFWYYVIFPIVLFSFNGNYFSFQKRMILILSAILIFITVAKGMMEGYLIWLIGVGVYCAYESTNNFARFVRPWVAVIAAILFFVSLIDSKMLWLEKATGISNDLTVALCFSVFLISIKNKSILFLKRNIVIASKWLSEISYTLYLFHFPLVLLIFILWYKDKQETLSLIAFLVYIFWLSLLLFLAYLVWWLFERNTPSIRQYLEKLYIRLSISRFQ